MNNERNRLPGSEKLTRPEEIKQLSKYLKGIREIYDENLRLEDQLIGTPGRTTGKIPEIGKLPGSSIKTPERKSGEVNSLSGTRLGIEDTRDPSLSEKRLNLEDTRENNLVEKRLGIKDERNTSLSDKRLNLEDTRDSNLSEKRLNLEDTRENELGDKRLDLEAREISSLENKRLNLEDSRENELSDTRLDLTDKRNLELGNKKLRLEDIKDPSLEDTKLELPDKEKTKVESLYDTFVDILSSQTESPENLSNVKLEIKDDRSIVLGETRIDLKDERDTKLSDTRLNLQDDRDQSLSEKRLELEDERENELSDKRLDLKDDRENNLGDKRLDLEDERENNLSEKRLNLEDLRENELSEKRLGLEDTRKNELSEKRLDLEDERENELSDKRLNLEDIQDPSLSEKRLDLEDTRENKLSETKLNLDDEREIELGERKVGLEDTRENSLSEKLVELENDQEDPKLSEKTIELKEGEFKDPELGDKKIGITDDRKIDLGDRKQRLVVEDKVEELGSKKIEIHPDNDVSLGEKVVGIYDDRELELGDKKLGIVDDRETELGDKRIGLTDDREISLGEKILDLYDDRETELGNKRLDLIDERENELGDRRLDLIDERENELGEKLISLIGEIPDTELRDKIIEMLEDNSPEGYPEELYDSMISMLENQNGEPEELYDAFLGMLESLTESPESLSSKIIEGLENKNSEKGELESKVIDGLENKGGSKDSLESKIISGLSNQGGSKDSLESKVIEGLSNQGGSKDSLESKKLDMLENQGEEKSSLEDKKIDGLENKGGSKDSLEDKKIDRPEYNNDSGKGEDPSLGSEKKNIIDNTNNVGSLLDIVGNVNLPAGSRAEALQGLISPRYGLPMTKENADTFLDMVRSVSDLPSLTSQLSDEDLYNLAMKITTAGEHASDSEYSKWFSKVSALMSAYLSSSKISPKRALEFREAINNVIQMSYFGSKVALRVPTANGEDIYGNPTTYTAADKSLSPQITGTTRRDALTQLIVEAVDFNYYSNKYYDKYGKLHHDEAKGSNTPKLPGQTIGEVVSDAVNNVTSLITGGGEHKNPINKPLTLGGIAMPAGPGDAFYQAANNRTNSHTVNAVGDTIGTTFYDRYWSSPSFKQTLEDLCPIIGAAPVVSLLQLKETLKASPYITTPGKFTTEATGSYNTQTLDTNMYWEVVLEPYCNSKGTASNGGWSYLPAIDEINTENAVDHGVGTNYGLWAPINGFELQKSKLSTKNLSLFNGEITYPIGMEFTNELRLTFVDDGLKSWRRYFEKCAEVAVYNSEPHDEKYYNGVNILGIGPSYIPTAVDKKNICIALYKNITFLITIYILSPQYNLLKKYKLLCVLKDFSEEYVGEIDSSGTDLNVTFSIVGENPTDTEVNTKAQVASIKNLATQALLYTRNLVRKEISTSVSLL